MCTYHPVLLTITDIDECSTGNPCDTVSTTCINNPGSYTCECKSGFASKDAFSCMGKFLKCFSACYISLLESFFVDIWDNFHGHRSDCFLALELVVLYVVNVVVIKRLCLYIYKLATFLFLN